MTFNKSWQRFSLERILEKHNQKSGAQKRHLINLAVKREIIWQKHGRF